MILFSQYDFTKPLVNILKHQPLRLVKHVIRSRFVYKMQSVQTAFVLALKDITTQAVHVSHKKPTRKVATKQTSV